MTYSPISLRKPLHRRHFLRGSGAAMIGLPFLEAMTPVCGAHPEPALTSPKRFVAMCATLGFHGPYFFPDSAGKHYQLSPYLKHIASHRNNFTVFSGLSHPDQQGNNGHASEMTWLTSAQRPGLAGFRNTISLDQLIANEIGTQTRFPSLVLSTRGRSMSWTASGVEIPGETSPSRLFKSLFLNGSDTDVAHEVRQLQQGRSILDTVFGEAKRLEKNVSSRDRRKVEEYLTAVRELEQRLQQSQEWTMQPKPTVETKPPVDILDRNDAIGKQRLLSDMIVLSLQSDSTRTVTFQLSAMNAIPTINGVRNDWHNLSHHGKDPAKIEELKIIEDAEFTAFNSFLNQLKAIEENGQSLLDSTTVLFGSNLGNASSHSTHNVPILLAGGGFHHGKHLSHDKNNNPPLANLFVSIAQQMGVEIDSFGSSTAAGIAGFDHA
ncbi:MAG: DUF1552 domain-containing protein [Pirellulales bacterium]